MDTFAGSTLLITGGTGSFGNAVLKRFLDSSIREIRIFSRDELKQDDMRHKYQRLYPDLCHKIKFYVGDVRDYSSICNAMVGVDYVFHAAALKQVPSCEFFPIEAVKTNILGTENVLNAAINEKVKKVICLSTDKASYPINAMGMSKALMEKVVMAKSRSVGNKNIDICCTRYGNVLYSRGSVVPLFVSQIKSGGELTITDPDMTRFIMTLDEAVDLVVFAFINGNNGDLFVQKADSSTIYVLAEAVRKIFCYSKEYKYIGLRHGEKTYETLLTNEEQSKAIDMGKFYRVPTDKRGLNYDSYLDEGTLRNGVTEFNSKNTRLLSVDETVEKLLTVSEIQDELRKWNER